MWPLNTTEPLRRTALNRVFAAVYTCAIFGLLYHHVQIIHSRTPLVSLSLLLSDTVLAFMWATMQVFRMRPIRRKEFPENLLKVMKPSEFPALDVFVCTADPYKEPPINVVNTALSVVAFDYPTDKLSVYVSDDGGSAATLFAFVEAAKFARHWLPFCRKNNVLETNPDAYFSLNHAACCPETQQIEMMYRNMKVRVADVVNTGKVSDEYITSDQEREAFNKWTDNFSRYDHPTVIQVLIDNGKDEDTTGHFLPNLIYVSREKSKSCPSHFKAGALNAMLRVSATMTNAPIVLTLDCDTSSNDPQTPLRVLCYVSNPVTRSNLSFVQFPQRFRGLSSNDIYAAEFRRLFFVNLLGFDGLKGATYVGTGTFFCRRALFGSPSNLISPEIPELHPNYAVDKPIQSPSILSLAHHVASCNYENRTNWGSKMGFRYGSLTEDYYTGYRLHCEGWRSIYCMPDRPAFYGDAPITLFDFINQYKRWAIGGLQMAFARYSPFTVGTKTIGLMGLAYGHYAIWPIWCIPTLVYALIPQLALLKGVSIFPKVSEPWFLLYVFMFLGAYGQDFIEFVLEGGTFGKWWNDQRMWMIMGPSCFLFGSFEYLLKSLGISAFGFNVTSKVLDNDQSKRYELEMFDFGVPSPMFVPLAMAAIINLFSFFLGLLKMVGGSDKEGLVLQMLIAGFIMVNCWPIYEAMVLRSDACPSYYYCSNSCLDSLYISFSHFLKREGDSTLI
ncbi:cellulose synthase-like protein G3 [Citrus sinensis]|uniref:Cellulose synthase-like protein G3 n=1 Tax=Citrus sinensis TaxID=2711 RepID=A0ACB8LNT8_CITSI|nr:cellulose synthase-like protein G3 [Citrus sinensis]